MSLFKCKMCGGDLEIVDGITIAECEYCGTKQTVPKAMDENLQNIFNRANTLRMKSEFDKAEKLYEKIIEMDTTQSEAYWGLILCKYGIEYVDDPTTSKKIPTCHRASYESIIADEDYKSAIENADNNQIKLYEEQAKEIDRIQKEILAIAQKEETYDVFICYKETDNNGKRTQDSVIANDIYYQLTQEGFKVFYAAITLEGKLGSAYEPIIFAALNSAKVMLSIGTKPEYFNAVWVKNEWSRFLKIIKKDRSKILIPCYKDMDAYELPEEFAHLQAQDMSKIGFINDIVRGIKKVIIKDNQDTNSKVKEKEVSNNNVTPLLKRTFIFLEDSKWSEANEYCEKVLDIDPECGEAYLGKLLSELKVNKKEDLKKLNVPFDNAENYNKIMRYGNESLIEELKQYNIIIKNRIEENRKESIYKKALELSEQQTAEKQFEASKEFEKIPGFKDSDARAKECILKYEELEEIEFNDDIYNVAIIWMEEGNYDSAIEKFQTIIDWKDSKEKILECEKLNEKQIQERKIANRKKKIKGTILITCIVIGIIFAINWVIIFQKTTKGLEYEFNEVDNSYSVEGLGFFIGSDLVIPSEYRGFPVTSIRKYAFWDCTSLESIEISNSVTSIGEYAFWDCTSLKEVIFEEGSQLTSIGGSAFEGCTSLENIEIPNSVTSIGRSAFEGCTSLENIEIPNSVTSIGGSAFEGCTSLESIIIPESVISIGPYAFLDHHLIIYCEAKSKPSGWYSSWTIYHNSVVWGYTGE